MLHRAIICLPDDALTTTSISVAYENIRTVDTVVYNTYQEAAVAAGIVDSYDYLIEIFKESEVDDPRSIRLMFVNMTILGYPTILILEDEYYVNLMSEDICIESMYKENFALKKEALLQKLQDLFQNDHNKEMCDYGLPTPRNPRTELGRIQIEYQRDPQQERLHELLLRYPLTNEQKPIYEQICRAIKEAMIDKEEDREAKCRMFFITGVAGSGKTEFAKKIMAFTRSVGGVAVGCAATALAATIYNDGDNFQTAHSLFAFPVENEVEDDFDDKVGRRNVTVNNDDNNDSDNSDSDNESTNNQNSHVSPPHCVADSKRKLQCKLYESKYKQRKELLDATNVILWDECSSNHRNILESLHYTLHKLENKVLILMGGYEQILPIIDRFATKWQIINACIRSSYLWENVETFILHRNLRLTNNDLNSAERYRMTQYEKYLQALSRGDEIQPAHNYFAHTIRSDVYLIDHPLTDTENTKMNTKDMLADTLYYVIKNVAIVTESELIEDQLATLIASNPKEYPQLSISTKAVLQFLYGRDYENFTPNIRKNIFICAATNKRVKFWNEVIQRLNVAHETITLTATNELMDVDDTYGYIKDMFNVNGINDEFDDSDVPDHTLKLKVNDVCLLTINYSKSEGLTKNTKVRIVWIAPNRKRIGVYLYNSTSNLIIYLPRLKFKYTINHGVSYSMVQTQSRCV